MNPPGRGRTKFASNGQIAGDLEPISVTLAWVSPDWAVLERSPLQQANRQGRQRSGSQALWFIVSNGNTGLACRRVRSDVWGHKQQLSYYWRTKNSCRMIIGQHAGV